MNNILLKLRNIIAKNNIDIYMLPRTDQFQSQYLKPIDQRVQYISGFSGSNALSIISQKQAVLWTDGRYFLQAQKQLYQGWKMQKMIQGQKKWFQYCIQNYPKNSKIGFDSKLITAQNAIARLKYFKQKQFNFIPIKTNLIDQIRNDQIIDQKPQIFSHQKWSGRSFNQKINWIRQRIKQKNGSAAFFSDLSEIAWILNLRSSQIPFNPFFKSFLKIGKQNGTLYLPKNHPSINNQNIINHLKQQNISISSDEPIFQNHMLICKKQLNYSIYLNIQKLSPIQWQGIGIYRAVRNQKQLNGFRRCHLYDGIAMAQFWSWRSKQEITTQYKAAQKINSFRKNQPLNKGLSFQTISAAGPNGAIIHYRPMEKNSSTITKQTIHLVDSGGQYLDGTTDVTRVFHFGIPSQEQKQAYTRVLLGNLQIQKLKWPTGHLTGANIDILARKYLWQKNWDYNHGTGHGVGLFGGVHQSPVGISRLNTTKLLPGMIVTNEPGLYLDGKFGIRIQNMLVVRQQNNYSYFQNLTLCPYDRNLIQKKLLNIQFQKQINNYHQKVWQKLSLLLQGEIQVLDWLRKATLPL